MDDHTVFLPWILERHAQLGAATEVRAFRRTESGERSVYSGIFGPENSDALLSLLRPRTPRPRRRIPPDDHPREGEASFHFTLNGVKLELAAYRWGRLERVRETVKDSDIIVTSLFLIDVDPERPSNTSATDDEKELALEVAESIDTWLAQKGVSTIRADSGNGYHLLVPLVPCRRDEIARAARDGQDLLKLLDARFSRPGAVKVDIGNFNPSRLSKLYGTLAVKGRHTKERPHRYSSIDLSSVPPDVDLCYVLREEIDVFRASAGRTARRPSRSAGAGEGARAGKGAGAEKGGSAGKRGSAGKEGAPGSRHPTDPDVWRRWREDALMALSLEDVYCDLLTGKVWNDGWLECRDPSSSTGDRNPSAGVADGTGTAERGTFHSFISGDTHSIFDFLIQQGLVADFQAACVWVTDHSGVALPSLLRDLSRSRTSGDLNGHRRGQVTSGDDTSAYQLSQPDEPIQGCRQATSDSPIPGTGQALTLGAIQNDEHCQASCPIQHDESPPQDEGYDGHYHPGRPIQPDESLPENEGFDLDLIDIFLKEFRAEQDRKRKPEMLRDFLAMLVQAPMLEQHIALEELHRSTGYPLPALRRTLAELQREDSGDELEDPPGDVPVLDMVRGQEAVSALFKRLIVFLRPLERFYSRQAGVLFLQRGMPPLVVTEGNLSGLLTGMVEFRMFQRSGGRRQVIGYETLPPNLCKAFVNSPRVRQLLPPLATYSQAPFFASDWSFIGRSGYYPVDGGVYYDGPAVEPRPHCTKALDALARGSFWKEPIDRINFLGAMLTALTLSRWTNGHGVIMVNGNRTGIGKSILVQAVALVTDGRKAQSITFGTDQNEFEKQMATQVDQGGRVIFIDNIKLRWPVESAVLERTVTDWVPNFRRLGTNTSITRDQNDLLVCLTMNRALLGADMRRRVLPINLHVEGPKTAHKDAVPDPKTWLLRHRLDLVAELAGMVRVWLEAGRPMDRARATHTTSHEWAATIDAILCTNGLEGFLSNYDASMGAFDQDYQLMLEICREHHGLEPQTAAEWATVLGSGLLEARFKDRHGQAKSTHAQTQIVGRLSNGYQDVPLEVDGECYYLVRSQPNGATHSPLFRFVRLEA